MSFTLTVEGFADGDPIPATFAFCAGAGTGDNRNPALRWSGAPEGTRSFAVTCVDPDAPTDPTDVNVEGRTVSASMPRAEFTHWLLVDVPAGTSGIDEGADSDGVIPKGEDVGPGAAGGIRGRNDYTAWFEGDADMAGTYGGYDGPCPPANDELVHRYVFTVHALDVERLGLDGPFGLEDVRAAMEGHVLAEASWTGTYTLNPDAG